MLSLLFFIRQDYIFLVPYGKPQWILEIREPFVAMMYLLDELRSLEKPKA